LDVDPLGVGEILARERRHQQGAQIHPDRRAVQVPARVAEIGRVLDLGVDTDAPTRRLLQAAMP